MSTLQATNLKNASSASNNIVLDTAGNATVAGTMAMGSSYLRNKIINGDMRIDQRYAGASVTPTTGIYIIDRWTAVASVSSKFSVQQNAGAVTPPAGFTNYFGFTSLSAYSVGATETFAASQAIEGFNVADLAWGTANAQSVTVSFWVRSSLTGTFGGAVRNSSIDRSYPFTYAISAANTWEYKTVVIPGDTSGTWLTNNGVGLYLGFSIGAGSTRSGTAGSWAATNYTSATGAVSVVGTNGATWYITGVQLEPGTVATPFERRQYGQELALCQRYYQVMPSGMSVSAAARSTTAVFANVILPVYMRAAPSVAFTLANVNTVTGATFATPSALSLDSATVAHVGVNATVSGVTTGQGGNFYTTGTNGVMMSAEL